MYVSRKVVTENLRNGPKYLLFPFKYIRKYMKMEKAHFIKI